MSYGRRIRHLVASNMHALLERAEDPTRMLRALEREIGELLEELGASERELRTDLKMIERDHGALERRIAARQSVAEKRLEDGDEKGAREAVEQRLELDAQRDALAAQLARCHEALERVAEDRQRLEERRAEAQGLGKQVVQRIADDRVSSRYASAADDCLKRNRDRMARIEDRLARMEARVEAWDKTAPTPPPVPAASATDTDPAVEEALEALRQRVGER